jgi:hypothetical protein
MSTPTWTPTRLTPTSSTGGGGMGRGHGLSLPLGGHWKRLRSRVSERRWGARDAHGTAAAPVNDEPGDAGGTCCGHSAAIAPPCPPGRGCVRVCARARARVRMGVCVALTMPRHWRVLAQRRLFHSGVWCGVGAQGGGLHLHHLHTQPHQPGMGAGRWDRGFLKAGCHWAGGYPHVC